VIGVPGGKKGKNEADLIHFFLMVGSNSSESPIHGFKEVSKSQARQQKEINTQMFHLLVWMVIS